MEVEAALSRDGDQVPAAVIVKGHVQRLVNIANPVPKALKEPKLAAYV